MRHFFYIFYRLNLFFEKILSNYLKECLGGISNAEKRPLILRGDKLNYFIRKINYQ